MIGQGQCGQKLFGQNHPLTAENPLFLSPPLAAKNPTILGQKIPHSNRSKSHYLSIKPTPNLSKAIILMFFSVHIVKSFKITLE